MKTRLMFNNFVPFKGFLAMTLFPFIFVRKEAADRYNVVVNNHEHIHTEQQREMLAVGVVFAAIAYPFIGWWAILFLFLFLIWYGLEWLARLAQYRDGRMAYRNISFEREAYANERDLAYLGSRKRFSWLKCIFRN